MDIDLWKVIREAIRRVPQLRWALGIAGIIAIIALVKTFQLSLQVAVLGSVVMLVLMVALMVFAGISLNKPMTTLALVFTWFSMILVMAVALTLFLGVFVGWPVNMRWLVEHTTASSDCVNSSDRVPFATELTFGNSFNISHQKGKFSYGISSIERDPSARGQGLRVERITLKFTGDKKDSQVLWWDLKLLLGGESFQLPEGVRTNAPDPANLGTKAPCFIHLQIGPFTELNSYDYSITFDFSTLELNRYPTDVIAFRDGLNKSFNAPEGLQGQILMWTGADETNVDISKIILSVQGTMPKK
jgi:hypothetical protein